MLSQGRKAPAAKAVQLSGTRKTSQLRQAGSQAPESPKSSASKEKTNGKPPLADSEPPKNMSSPKPVNSVTANKSSQATRSNRKGQRVMMTKKMPPPRRNKFDTKLGTAPLPKIKRFVDKFDDMLEGKLDNLPPRPPSEVRIFLSSTFSDMRQERNWLVKTAYPRLKEYCYSELDLDFQVVDMRWGVTDDATNDHDTERLCLMEIANCQRLSLGPNFVTLLGQRYGFRPIPTELLVEEFSVLYNEAEAMNHPHTQLLREWYLRDENAVPNQYILQPIRSKLAHFGDNSDENARKRDGEEWQKIFNNLQDIIRKAAEKAVEKGRLNEDKQHETIKSVTEFEINNGLLKAKAASKHVMCFIRDFTSLDDTSLKTLDAHRFIDTITVNGQTVVDTEVEALRKNARDAVSRCLPNANIRKYSIPWHPGGVQAEQKEEHKTYLESFSKDFENGMKTLINSARSARENLIPVSEYYSELDETLQHLHFCQEKCANFKGQKEILSSVHAYLKNPKNRKPLVIHAESGVGKTCVMAMVMKSIPDWFGSDSVRMIRFLGTSPASSDIYDVLFSVMGQLADVHDQILEPDGYQNMKSLIGYLPRFLRNISRKTKEHIFVLLDSIDQLSYANGAHGMTWLPTEYPANLHIVLSMLPETNGCLDNTRKLLKDSNCFLELKPIPESTGQEIITAYLASKGRTITTAQNNLILKCLEKAPSPLFLKLLMDKSLKWHSCMTVSNLELAPSVREAINQQFSDLEQKFGKKFIQAALGYITLGHNGLSEMELEDTLSCNDEVLNEVYQYHDPPIEGIIRIPGLLWARVRHDIREYLAERLSDGKTTIFWYHRQFIQAAQERYVADSKTAKLLHLELANLFLAQSGVKKTITLTKRKKTIIDADRQITAQPLIPKNKRKLVALPVHLFGTGDKDFVKEYVLCNLNFMMVKMKALSLKALLKDYEEAIVHFGSDAEMELVQTCLQSLKFLSKPDQLPGELLARVPGKKDMPYVSSLLAEARSIIENGENPTLLPLYACLQDDTDKADSTDQISSMFNSVAVKLLDNKGQTTLAAADKEGTIKFWDVSTMHEIQRTVVISCDTPVKFTSFLENNHSNILLALAKESGTLKLIDASNGAILADHMTGHFLAMAHGPNEKEVFVLTKDSGEKKLTVYQLELNPSVPRTSTVKIFPIKEPIPTENVEIHLSGSKKFLLFKAQCPAKELEIILKTEKKGNLVASKGIYKFYALNLQTSEVKTCFRVLTNIPTIGVSWVVSSTEDWVLIGLRRTIIVWDLTNWTCDQKMSKGTKIPMYYRPWWIEDERKGNVICHGSTLCMERGLPTRSHFIVGSEDGFLLVYDRVTGLSICPDVGPKPNHGRTPVTHCALSDDNQWAASVGKDNTLVFWSIRHQCDKAFKISLNIVVNSIQFSPCCKYLVVHGSKKVESMKILLFKIIPGK